jgi:hypothetical protein
LFRMYYNIKYSGKEISIEKNDRLLKAMRIWIHNYQNYENSKTQLTK